MTCPCNKNTQLEGLVELYKQAAEVRQATIDGLQNIILDLQAQNAELKNGVTVWSEECERARQTCKMQHGVIRENERMNSTRLDERSAVGAVGGVQMSLSKREKQVIYAASGLISRIPAPAFGASSATVAALANYQMDVERVLPVVRDLFEEILEGNLNNAERMITCMDRWFEKRNAENWQRSWTLPEGVVND